MVQLEPRSIGQEGLMGYFTVISDTGRVPCPYGSVRTLYLRCTVFSDLVLVLLDDGPWSYKATQLRRNSNTACSIFSGERSYELLRLRLYVEFSSIFYKKSELSSGESYIGSSKLILKYI